jgi:hypothetical protein
VTSAEGSTRARHLVDQDAGQAHVLPTRVVRLAPREGDLRGHAAALALPWDPLRSLVTTYGLVELNGDLRLETRRGTRQPLERAQHLHSSLVVGWTVSRRELLDPCLDPACVQRRRLAERCVEHVFDHTGMAVPARSLNRRPVGGGSSGQSFRIDAAIR